jgi:hypothetical protein
MVVEILSVTLGSSLTRVAWQKEIFGICVARWYACGLLSFTWCSGLWGSLVYFKSTRRYMRTRIVCFTSMNPIYTVPPFYNVLFVCWQYAILICSYDRIRYKKTDWYNIHRKYVKTFEQGVAEAKRAKGIHAGPHSDVAFNNYIRWFLPRTRV